MKGMLPGLFEGGGGVGGKGGLFAGGGGGGLGDMCDCLRGGIGGHV